MSEFDNSNYRNNETFGSSMSQKNEIKTKIQTSDYLDSLDDDSDTDCQMTVLELNDGQPKFQMLESLPRSNGEKPKKFRINIVKHKKDLETRKSQLMEEREMFELKFKRFPAYIISNINCVNQGDYESPKASNDEEDNERTFKPTGNLHSNFKVKQKPKKIKYCSPEEAIKFYESFSDVKIKNEDDYDKEMMRKFPLGETVFKDKIHMTIIYIPECEILRKLFIGYYGLNLTRFSIDEFEDWCQKNMMFNSKSMYESYFTNNQARECNLLLKGLMNKYQVGIILSDFFGNRDFAAYRALAVFGESKSNIKLCIEEFKSKLPVNISPYLHENPNDENSLAPNDFEGIDYFRRNYHRLMFSEDVFF